MESQQLTPDMIRMHTRLVVDRIKDDGRPSFYDWKQEHSFLNLYDTKEKFGHCAKCLGDYFGYATAGVIKDKSDISLIKNFHKLYNLPHASILPELEEDEESEEVKEDKEKEDDKDDGNTTLINSDTRTPIGIYDIVECSAFKTLDHNEDLNQKLKDAAAYFFSVCDNFFGNARLEGFETSKDVGESSNGEAIVITLHELSPLINFYIFTVIGMNCQRETISHNKERICDSVLFSVIHTFTGVVNFMLTKMEYNEVSFDPCPYPGATYSLETGTIDYAST
ncbi:unnamed protein product [Ambrosiozyma monospora]|uniref:Unnamed protein product n=1 Tax=Ambrosiozyma monospora TaxID=43982 RepID=A0ACB5T595_AMBMO|nr:unnamed protein product [Ambrosiozyma monospora]